MIYPWPGRCKLTQQHPPGKTECGGFEMGAEMQGNLPWPLGFFVTFLLTGREPMPAAAAASGGMKPCSVSAGQGYFRKLKGPRVAFG